jgi:hypothetical protein
MNDPFDPLGGLMFDPMAGIDFGMTPRRGRQKKFAPLSPEELNTETSSLLDNSIGLLQYIGETLDKPGRAVRGLLDGRPEELLNLVPFSDAAGLTDPKTATSGRDLLEHAGILDPNEAGLDAGDVAGFAAEIALDPTTYLSFGGSALSKGGQALKKAGVLGKVNAKARIGRTVGDVLSGLDDVGRAAATEALQAAAMKSGGTVDDLLGESVGGLAKLGVPFTDSGVVLGTGDVAQGIANFTDKVGSKIRYGKIGQYSPGTHFESLFNPKRLGAVTPEAARFAEQLSSGYENIVRGARSDTARDIAERAGAGLLDDAGSDAIRKTIERGDAQFPHWDKRFQVADDIKNRFNAGNEADIAKAAEYGIEVSPHGEDLAGISYAPRQAVDEIPNANFSSRRMYDKNWRGGTTTLNDIYADPAVRGAKTVKEAADVIQFKYGGLYRGPEARQNFEFLANSVKSKKASQSEKLFGYDVSADIQSRRIALKGEIKRADTMLDAIKQYAKPITEMGSGEPVMTIGEILPQIRLKDQIGEGGAIPKLLSKLGIAADENSLKAVRDMVVPERIAKDLINMNNSFNAPEAVNKLVGAFDKLTNVFKVGVLSWPSRVVRDFMSGQVMNVLTGNFSPEALQDAASLIRGGTVESSLNIPIVKKMLAERFLPETAENGTQMLRELAYADQMFSGAQGIGGTGSLSGTASQAVAGRTKELVSEFAGMDPLTFTKIGKAGKSMKPWDVRAITESPTGFRPVAITEEASRLSDGMNRLVPYLNALQNGTDPKAAAELVNAIQVNYKPEAFTKFERKALKRLFPFYSFASRVVPETLKQLIERPGGGIAQALRLSNAPRSGDAFIPDYVSEGMAIPLGTEGRYLTGFGLMHEALGDVAALRPSKSGTVTRTAQKIGSMLNPALKFPIELATGVNMYTGRPQRELYQYPTDEPIINMLLGNTPMSRTINTARKLTDERKGLDVKAAALLTGVGITDLSGGPERAKELNARRLLQEKLLESPRIRQHQELYVPEEMYPLLSDEEKRAMRAYYTMARNRQKAAKDKKKSAP